MVFAPEGETGIRNPEIDPSLDRERLVQGERQLADGNFVDAVLALEDIYGSEKTPTLTQGRAARELAQAAQALYDPDITRTHHWKTDAVQYADAALAIDDAIVESQGENPTVEALAERSASATQVGALALSQVIELELKHSPIITVEADIPAFEVAQNDMARAKQAPEGKQAAPYEADALKTWSLYESLHGNKAKGLSFALKALVTAHKVERDNKNLDFLQKKRLQAQRFVGGLAALQVNVFAAGTQAFPSLRRRALRTAQHTL